MRIRRRPALSFSGDPALQIRTQNGSLGNRGGGEAAATAGEGLLHLVGDLLKAELGKINPSSSLSLSDLCIHAPPIPASPELSQALKEEEEEDDEENEVDSNDRCNTKINGTSGAVAAPSWEMTASPPQRHAREGNDIGNENGGVAETKPARDRERKEKVKARASSASGSSNNCTGEGDKEGHDSGSRKRRRSAAAAVLKEGSRCSRMNGRGWRCCQQTLVGYSLCEHHLGKGRLRSVTSVRGQLGTSKPRWCIDGRNGGVVASSSLEKEPPPPPPAVCAASINRVDQVEEEEEAEEEEEEMARKTTRKKKVGTVKARSISSLLENFEVSPVEASAASPPRAQAINNELN